MRILR
jgi:hypothetical protein